MSCNTTRAAKKDFTKTAVRESASICGGSPVEIVGFAEITRPPQRASKSPTRPIRFLQFPQFRRPPSPAEIEGANLTRSGRESEGRR